jgi:hypothetical protein
MVIGAKQSNTMSLIEAAANVVVGFALAVLTQLLVFPFFSLSVGLEENLIIGGIFTVVSLLRSYTLRRFFEAVRARDGSHRWSCP